MLITCPECSHSVSDKAQACPQCGFPISASLSPAPVRPAARSSSSPKKFKKLPNGSGCVAHLTGKRRKPYAAYPPTTEFRLNGSPIRGRAIGYFETYHEALVALTNYGQNPYSVPSLYTFSMVYEKFMAEKFEDPNSSIELASSTYRNYKWAYGKCDTLYDKPMNTIFKEDMQAIMDGLIGKSYSSCSFLRTLFKGMFQYAIENGIVQTDYSEYIKIKRKREYEKGVPFTQEEIDTLWKNKSNYNVRIALILIYSGLRISELKNTVIDLPNKQFVGGIKTAAGKSRVVPIHDSIYPFVQEFDQEGFSVGNYQDKLFHKTLTSLGFPYAASGEKHTPHDCRHTFSWLADKYKMDDISKHLIMGHSLGPDVEKNTYVHRTLDELRTEMQKIQTPSD